jgi:hypothetical protein
MIVISDEDEYQDKFSSTEGCRGGSPSARTLKAEAFFPLPGGDFLETGSAF